MAGWPQYREDLALVHDLGYAFHADRCAPGILDLLTPVLAAGGLVLELGCGSGALTRHLVAAGHRVVATDASPAMVARCRANLGDTCEVTRLALPDDELPPADAVVSTGHVLSYLPDEAAIHRALIAAGRALRPGGLLALDLLDQAYGTATQVAGPSARVAENWAVVSQVSLPDPARLLREITTFVRRPDGSWRRDDERHENTLVDTTAVPRLLASVGIEARVGRGFGGEQLPEGLATITGRRAEEPR